MLSENAEYLASQHRLMDILQEELQWIEVKQNSMDPAYVSIVDGLQSLSKIDSSLSQISKDLLTKFNELTLHIKLLIDLCISQVHNIEQKALEVENCLHKQKDRADGLQQLTQIQLKKLGEWEHQYESLKSEYNDALGKLEEEKKKAKRERKEVKKTFLQVRQNTEYDKMLLQNLQQEKFSILELMESQKKTNEKLKQELQMLKQKISEHERQITSSATKLSYEEKRSQKLQQQLAEKDKLISNFMQYELAKKKQQEEQTINVKEFMEDMQERKHQEEHQNIQVNKKTSFVGTFNLADEITNFKQEFQTSFQRINSVSASVKNSIHSVLSHEEANINHSVIEQQFEPSQSRIDMQNSRKVAIPDFYFAHYMLTVQSIKLKLGQQQFFGIDMNENYTQMIAQRVPFHQWDEWIKRKLKQLSKVRE